MWEVLRPPSLRLRRESEDGLISVSDHGLTPAGLLARRLATAPAPYRAQVEELCVFGPPSSTAAGGEIIPQACRQAAPRLLVAGAAGEVRTLDQGRRQIVRLRLPGDLLYACDREAVVALSRVRTVDARTFLAQLDRPETPGGLRRAWLALAQADQDMLREQLVRLGRMSASERTAHVLLETHHRLSLVGLAAGDEFNLPVTQETLSDLLGLSGVHLNRVLQALRRDGLISLRNGYVSLLDRPGLVSLCAWRPVGAPTLPRPTQAMPAAGA